jgi:undecaprenyl-diphosphatase
LTVGVVLAGLWDSALFGLLRSETPIGRAWALAGYWLGQGGILAPALLGLYLIGRWTRRTALKGAGIQGLAVLALSGAGVQIVKHLVGRPRPRLTAEGVVHWGPALASGLDSFPSGHMTTTVAVAVVLGRFLPETPLGHLFRSLLAAWAMVVGTARVVGGSHFPSDVLGGALLGLLLAVWVTNWFDNRAGGGTNNGESGS